MKIVVDCRLINKTQNTGISRYTEFLINYYIYKYGAKNVFLITNDREFVYDGCFILYTNLKPYNILHFIKYSKFIDSLEINIFTRAFLFGINKSE